MDFDSFFNAIAQQESGGNYSAINGMTGALGKYQVLPSNVPYWSQKYLGVKWNSKQFLGDPRKQDALARAVLQDYYDRYGVRGAAAAWYSGDHTLANSYRPQRGGPSIGSYVDSVIARAAKGGVSPIVGDYSIPTTVIDNTVKPETAKPAAPNTSQMGAVTSPGAEAVTATGAGAVAVAGAENTAGRQHRPQEPLSAPQTGQMGSGTVGPPAGREMALQSATRWLGTPYVFGGGGQTGPTASALAHGNFDQVGFDCSGLIQFALAQAGIHAPRLSYDQLKMGQRVSMNQLQPGDLVGFGDGGHIALYLGGGRIVEAPYTGASVQVRTLSEGEDAWGVSLANYYR
jgi:cell wall-associated NlpC family hydrolase